MMVPMVDDELLRVIGAATGGAQSFATAPQRLTGGFWAAIYGFELASPPAGWEGPLLLRVIPQPEVAAKEITVQRELAAGGYSTPRVVLSGDDAGVGGAFVIMTRAAGTSPLANLSVGVSQLPSIPRTLRRVPRLVADVAADLHRLDAQPIAHALAAAGVQLSPLGDAPYRRNIDAARDTPTSGPAFGELGAWLDRERPEVRTSVVCHGDLHPFNLLVADDGAVTVLDWTNAAICPAEFDIGFTSAFLRCPPLAMPAAAQPVLNLVGRSLCNQFLAAYEGQRHIDGGRLRWYQALQYGRCLAEAALGRATPGGTIGPQHPFELAAAPMSRQLEAITGVRVDLDPARP